MTYCLAAAVNDGLVFVSDSRTNAGADQVSTYSKMHRWGMDGECQFVLLSAGNLATTQSVLNRVQRDIAERAEESLANVRYMSDAAAYIGKLNKSERERHISPDDINAGFNPAATFILGGQIRGESPQLFMVYPEGNYISVSSITPFLQIGENKYGKPILDRVIDRETSLEDAARCALVSMDSTMQSNVTVGPPVEMLIYEKDSLTQKRYMRFDEHHPYYFELRTKWADNIRTAFNTLPPFNWESAGPPPAD